MTSARTARPSITTTITAPSVPSGLRRSICTQTSAYHGRVRGRLRRLRPTTPAGLVPGVASDPWALSVPDARIQEGIGEIDHEVESHDQRCHDEVHGLHDRIVQLRQRL